MAQIIGLQVIQVSEQDIANYCDMIQTPFTFHIGEKAFEFKNMCTQNEAMCLRRLINQLQTTC